MANVTEIEARSYELDPYGHVNNAVFVNWFEHGRLRYLADRGLSWTIVPEEYGCRVVIVRIDVSFHTEVRLGDRLALTSRITGFGRSSFTFEQSLRHADERVAATAVATMVCVDPDGGSVEVPAALRSSLEA